MISYCMKCPQEVLPSSPADAAGESRCFCNLQEGRVWSVELPIVECSLQLPRCIILIDVFCGVKEINFRNYGF